VIAALVLKVLNESVKTARLKTKLDELTQEYAIDKYNEEKNKNVGKANTR
jgi:hypothetical protein